MNKKKENSRRQFLRNTSFTALSLGMLPGISKANPSPKVNTKGNSPLLMCDPTTTDYYGQGPFYTPDAPTIEDNKLAGLDEDGTRMIISGRVYDLDCSLVISDAEIDIWHADDAGNYDTSGFKLRGKTFTNSQGFYLFETVKPGFYLNGSSYRPSHIHLKITAPGFDTLTTQLYFEDDPYIAADAAASINSGSHDATKRIIPLTTNSDGNLEGSWDIFVEGNGILSGNSNIHLDKGIIYHAAPNPFSDSVAINYGVFHKSKVSLSVYDMQGKLVANLEEKNLQPEKYHATWEPDTRLPNGHYFIALKINDLQVHYLRVVRQR